MKPFDLELAKCGHDVVTRDGRLVKILYWNRRSKEGFTIVGIIECPHKDYDETCVWYKDGNKSVVNPSIDDLFMKSTTEKMWGHYNKKTNEMNTQVFFTKTDALYHLQRMKEVFSGSMERQVVELEVEV